MSTVKPGDEVRVFDVNGSRMGQPKEGWRGVVVKVGRKLVTIGYGKRTGVFRLDDQKINDRYGNRWFATLEQAEQKARRERAINVLRSHGINLDVGHKLTLEQIEQLASVAHTWV